MARTCERFSLKGNGLLSILVGHSYFLKFDEKQRARAKPYPPLATIQIAALLRDAGHDVALFDAMLADSVEDFAARLAEAQPQVVVFYEDNYNFLSKMCLGRMREACTEMIAASQASGAWTFAAGSDATDAPEVYLRAGADAVIIGEGLATVLALVDRLNGRSSWTRSRLFAGLPDVVVAMNAGQSMPKAVAPLPVPALSRRPAWDLVDLDRYRGIWNAAHGYFSLNMAASRGCSFRCNWCAKPIWGDRYLQRSAHDVAAEMQYLKDEFQAEHVWFADDIFGFRPAWVEEFAEVLAENGGGMPFTIQLRADLISKRMASALARAGCSEVWIGAESGSQKILDAMNKGTTVSGIVRARRLLADEGVRVGFFLMLGYLGEELPDVLATRDLLSYARPDDVGVSVAYPLPGTKFHESVRRQLGRATHWRESKDLSMMFAGTYRSEFYHLVRDLLHDQVDTGMTPELQQRWDALVEREISYRQSPEVIGPLRSAAQCGR